jgi:deoxyribodipyrimidine photo-lyase
MSTALFWHRRDLRTADNAGLYRALKSGHEVIPVFIFDRSILQQLPENDQRMIFIHRHVAELQREYRQLGTELQVHFGDPVALIPQIAKQSGAVAVYTNRDYEPYALQRDKKIFELLKENNIDFKGYKDHVILEKNEVMKGDGTPYTVYTPYMRRWKETLTDFHLKPYPIEKYTQYLSKATATTILPTLQELGFEGIQVVDFPALEVPLEILSNYQNTRDIPSINGTSRLSVHLRFGTISIRRLAQIARDTNEKYFNELIWRDFYQMILFHFPHAAENAFKPAYDRIPWSRNEAHFEAWRNGKTGYPLVDAGIRELNATGFMHNRVRMVVASFLTKHLLLDWRWGAQYFAEKLLDFELASNSGGWQWAAGSGCDAAPYFRVFNPKLQLEKFDKELKYTKRWVPEYGTNQYPDPIVDHQTARQKAIDTYQSVLKNPQGQ